MNKATLVIIPSRLEGFGLVALEAALMARPVVATRVGGSLKLCCTKKPGLLTEQDNPATLAEAILFLLSQPQTVWRGSASAGSRSVQLRALRRCL